MARTTTRLLARILEEPDLVPAIQALEPAQLDALVREVGIEDAAELIAIATPEQFVHLIDEAWWSLDADDTRFDHRRFVTWLEVMLECGEAFVVQRLQQIPEETLALALSGHLFVLDVDTLGIGMAGASHHEAELAEKALDACLYLEFGDWVLVARDGVGWDAIVTTLLALDAADHDMAERLLDACRRATTDAVDDGGGLYEVLTAAQSLAEDAAAEREDRRAAGGWVPAADARAFLRGATAPITEPDGIPVRDPITRAYFRALDPAQLRTALPAASSLVPLLRAHGVIASPRVQLPSAGSRILHEALAELPPEVAAQRSAELVYLANVIVAAGRGVSPVDAARQVVEQCTRGLARRVGGDRDAAAVLREVGCDQLFRIGMARDPA